MQPIAKINRGKKRSKSGGHNRTVAFKNIGLREDVRALLDQVASEFQQLTGVKPDLQSVLTNALLAYKEKLHRNP